MPSNPVGLIPAYKCDSVVVELAEKLIASGMFQALVCVNDGSGPDYDSYFNSLRELGVFVIDHAINLGKGMALRTGMNHVACHYPNSVGIVTMDADGQHLLPDIMAVGQALLKQPHSLVMGCRTFDESVPLRSRFGNKVSKKVIRLFGGLKVSDTQTGLRGIPMSFVPSLLRLRTSGYDFELDMLLKTRDLNIPVIEVPIQTVYLDNNRSSSFNPILDSMRIYYVFIRFNISSVISVVIDYSIFSLLIASGISVAWSVGIGRVCAGSINFIINKNLVFKSTKDYRKSLALYVASLLMFGIMSYYMILIFSDMFGMSLLLSKVAAEALLYLFSFLLQRDIVFARRTFEQ
jgi:putative flippase GtrA